MSENTNNTRLNFQGTYEFLADAGGRVQFPAKWRPAEEVTLSVMYWKDEGQVHPSLLVLQRHTVQKMEDKLESMSFSDPKAQSLRRLLGGDSDDLRLDPTGRIRLPERLATKAKLGKGVVLVGMFDRFQIWSAELYKDIQAVDEVLRPEAVKLI